MMLLEHDFGQPRLYDAEPAGDPAVTAVVAIETPVSTPPVKEEFVLLEVRLGLLVLNMAWWDS